ncbi:MAG: succinate dehydrogenase, cytochrome b556 subunit [Pseudomonadota bacterium]
MASADRATSSDNRPLSPHLQIYAMRINMAMSIIHRITGAALYFGTILLAWWLISAAVGPEYFAFTTDILGSWLGRIVLFGYTWALLHHMMGGIRHFVWDLGYGFQLANVDFMCWASLVASVTLTLIIWGVALV